MPNWCSDSVTFIADDNNMEHLQQLHDLLSNCDGFCETADKGWIGNALVKQGIMDYEKAAHGGLDMRGFIQQIGEVEDNTLEISVESAWGPALDAYKLLSEHFSLKYVLCAVEESNDVFINTDLEGTIYPDKYRVGHEDEDDEYFDSFEKLLAYFKERGFEGETMEELKDFALDEDYNLNEFETLEEEAAA